VLRVPLACRIKGGSASGQLTEPSLYCEAANYTGTRHQPW